MLIKELTEIIEKEQKIIPFLKKLTDTEKRDLAPFLKKIRRKYNAMKNWKHTTGNDEQRNNIDLACYVCFNKTDSKQIRNVSNLAVSDFYQKNIHPWYVPSWFGDAINNTIPWHLEYVKIMEFNKKCVLNPSKELILRKLPMVIVYQNEKVVISKAIKNLELYEETIQEHIWYFFEEGSEIHWGKPDAWVAIFKKLINDKKIERNKVLEKTINTANKGFNKNLSGWFYDLLISLNPTENELLSFQNELFSALNSPQSKIVNTVLKYLKTLVIHSDFDKESFLENSSILLNSPTKSVATSTLMIFDKIAKTNPNLITKICLRSVEALLNSDEKIQTRASKIIQKYGDFENEELKNEINMYVADLFLPSKEILKDFISFSDDFSEDETFEIQEVNFLSEENKIETYETFDDLLFFISQALDNNEIYHLDLLLKYIPQIQKKITSKNVSKLDPILKRAFKLTRSAFELSDIMGRFINNLGDIMIKKYPKELESLIKHREEEIYKPIETPTNYLRVHYILSLKANELLVKNLPIELLSIPTHVPCWIDPIILINRITVFEKNNIEIDIYDFQIAIGRLPIGEFSSDITTHINKIKDVEIRMIFEYHLGTLALSKEQIRTPERWLQSVLIRNIPKEVLIFEEVTKTSIQKELGNMEWFCEVETNTYKDWNYRKKIHEEKTNYWRSLVLKDAIHRSAEKEIERSTIKSIYNHFNFERWWGGFFSDESLKILFLSPNNPSPLLNRVIYSNMNISKGWEVEDTKIAISFSEGLYKIWGKQNFNENTYLFLAALMLCDTKTSREYAAELWIKATQQNTMNQELLGIILGDLEFYEYGALKRFTDLIVANMYNISKFHNEQLLILIDNVLGKMNEKPIRNTKKLIELFFELKHHFSDYQISKDTLTIFEKWKEVKSLNSILTKS